MKKNNILRVLIIVLAVLATACGKDEKEKTKTWEKYGYRHYYEEGKTRVLREEFEVDGAVRTRKLYGEDGTLWRTTTVTCDEKTGIVLKETEEDADKYAEIVYDELGRKSYEFIRLTTDISWDEAIRFERYDLTSAYMDYNWIGAFDAEQQEGIDRTFSFTNLEMWSKMQCYNSLIRDFDGSTEMQSVYTYEGDSMLPQSVATVSSNGEYDSFLERGRGDIILSASFVTTHAKFDESYDPQTKEAVLRWQVRDEETGETTEVKGKKVYDDLGRLLSASVSCGDESMDIVAGYAATGAVVTVDDGTRDTMYYVTTTIYRYDENNRLARYEETRNMIDEDGFEFLMYKKAAEYEYDGTGGMTRTDYLYDSLGAEDESCLVSGISNYNADGKEVYSRIYYADPSQTFYDPTKVKYEISTRELNDPDIRGKVVCRTSTVYNIDGDVSEELRMNYVAMEADALAGCSGYGIYPETNMQTWILYSQETRDFVLEEETKEYEGVFDDEGRLQKVIENHSYPPVTTEYDELGRVCVEDYGTYRYITEYWEETK